MSNYWYQEPTNEQNDKNNRPAPSSGLLSSYRSQHLPAATPGQNGSPTHTPPQPQAPSAPASGQLQPRSQAPNMPTIPQTPSKPLPPWPVNVPASPQLQNLVANTVQMVRHWSGKMASVRQQVVQPPPAPLELYRPPVVSGPLLLPQAKPWKRSHIMRIVMLRRHRRERNRSGFTPGRIWTGVAIAFTLLIVILGSSGSAYAYSYYQSQLPRLQGIANQHITQTSRIYDRNQKLLSEEFNPNDGRRTPVRYNDLPQVLQDAMTSAEDPTFWTNEGFDVQGLFRAASCGGGCGGGSGITQQVIKNLTGNTQLTLNRKMSEASLSIGLTQQYPKSKILEMYFNVAAFDSQDLGVESAAEEYFGLKPTCVDFKCTPAIARLEYDGAKRNPLLGLARASLLASMAQNPPAYDPTSGDAFKQRALYRQQYVLNQMIKYAVVVDGLGPVTPQLAQQAENLTAKMTFTRYSQNKRARHFVDWTRSQMALALGNGNYSVGLSAFLTGGFQIRTTIDADLEDYVERAITRHLTQPEFQPFLNDYGPLNTRHNVNDASAVVINVKTGEILAMAGSADYTSNDPKINGNFNVATMGIGRPPGSSFKPIIYATTFEMGLSPGIILPDIKTNFPTGGNKPYVPHDYGGNNVYGGGNDTVRLAVADSRNIPAVKGLMYAGIDNVANMTRRLGITGLDDFVSFVNQRDHTNKTFREVFGYGNSLALGSVETSLLQMTGAYQTFANGGSRIPPQGVLDIWDNYGHHLYHYDPTHPPVIQAISPQVAYMMTSILTDEPSRRAEFGNDHILSFADQNASCATVRDCPLQVAAKTGTTDGFKDNWTMGYTPDVAVGVWAGNADDTEMVNTIGLTGAAPIWHSVIERANGFCPRDNIDCGNFNLGFAQHTFNVPGGLQKACVSSSDGLQSPTGGGPNCDWVVAGQQPQQKGVSPNPTDQNGNPLPPAPPPAQ